jgi:hypothetical protein
MLISILIQLQPGNRLKDGHDLNAIKKAARKGSLFE